MLLTKSELGSTSPSSKSKSNPTTVLGLLVDTKSNNLSEEAYRSFKLNHWTKQMHLKMLKLKQFLIQIFPIKNIGGGPKTIKKIEGNGLCLLVKRVVNLTTGQRTKIREIGEGNLKEPMDSDRLNNNEC